MKMKGKIPNLATSPIYKKVRGSHIPGLTPSFALIAITLAAMVSARKGWDCGLKDGGGKI